MLMIWIINYLQGIPEKVPHFSNQNEVNALVRDMVLARSNAEMFFSRMKRWNVINNVQLTIH